MTDNGCLEMRTRRTPPAVILVDALLDAIPVRLQPPKLGAKSRTAMVAIVVAIVLWLCAVLAGSPAKHEGTNWWFQTGGMRSAHSFGWVRPGDMVYRDKNRRIPNAERTSLQLPDP